MKANEMREVLVRWGLCLSYLPLIYTGLTNNLPESEIDGKSRGTTVLHVLFQTVVLLLQLQSLIFAYCGTCSNDVITQAVKQTCYKCPKTVTVDIGLFTPPISP